MGMAGAGASFLKLLTSGWVTFYKSKCVQILNLAGVDFEMHRFADFSAMWEPLEYCLKYGGNLMSEENACMLIAGNDCDWRLESFNMAVVFTLYFTFEWLFQLI